MDVRPAGTDPAGASFNPAIAGVSRIAKLSEVQSATAPASTADSVSSLLKELSPPDILKLLQVLEPPRQPGSGELLARLIRANSEDDIAAALSAVQQIASLDPQLAEGLRSQPELSAMRPEIEQLLSRLSSVVKLSAEQKLTQAAQLIDVHTVRKVPDWDAPPQSLLRVGQNLLDAGGLLNYAKAVDVAQVMLDALRFLPVPDDARLTASLRRPKRGGFWGTADTGARKQTDRDALNARWPNAPWILILLPLIALAILAALIFSR